MTLALLNLRKYKDVPEQTELNFVNWITLAQAILEQGSQPTDATEMDADEAMMGPDPLMPGSTADLGGMGMAGDPAAMGGMPQNVPVPEAMGLAPAGPGPMPNV
jgi:hypothetical protein